MSGEPRPGDVVRTPYGTGLVVEFNRLGCNRSHDHYSLHVHYGDGDWASTSDVRPLAVIDPEDREQVERLCSHLPGVHWYGTPGIMQAALREFATPTPPKPDEPEWLGAVVEDTEGTRWVRVHLGGCAWVSPRTGAWESWDRIDAVRVVPEDERRQA